MCVGGGKRCFALFGSFSRTNSAFNAVCPSPALYDVDKGSVGVSIKTHTRTTRRGEPGEDGRWVVLEGVMIYLC